MLQTFSAEVLANGRALVDEGAIVRSPDFGGVFYVHGRGGVYTVVLGRDEQGDTSTCSCPKGQHSGRLSGCKHVAGVLDALARGVDLPTAQAVEEADDPFAGLIESEEG